MKKAEFISIDLFIDKRLEEKLQTVSNYLGMKPLGHKPFVEPLEGNYLCAVSNYSLLMLSPMKVKDDKGEYMRYKFNKPIIVDLPSSTALDKYLSRQLSKLLGEDILVRSYTVTAVDVRINWDIVKELPVEKIKEIASLGFNF
ncbi:MAG: hypothetical protein ACFFBD_06170 [Candidatus Hodarchaeota archaeon]